MTQDRDERELRETARLLVSAGLEGPVELLDRFVEMVRVQMPDTDPVIMARGWLAAAKRERLSQAQSWPEPTDHQRLWAALEDCREHQVAVLPGVDDLGEVRRVVESATSPLRGVLWFSERSVFEALDAGVLRAGLRHGNGAPVEEGDHLAVAVSSCLSKFGVRSRSLQGGLEIATWWQRRP